MIVGESGAETNANGQVKLTFAVQSLKSTDTCSSRDGKLQKPKNGTFLVLDVTVTTGPSAASSLTKVLHPTDFSVVGPDGYTESDLLTLNAYTCYEGVVQIPIQLSPSSKYRGQIILDSPVPRGSLIYLPFGDSTGHGWEWKF